MRGRLSLTLMALVLLSVGCGADVGADPEGLRGSATAAPGNPGDPGDKGDPADLVGLWTVREAAGEKPGVILRLGEGMSLWRECGHLNGSWRAAAGGLFVGHVSGGSQACVRGPATFPAWLRQASGYRADGPDRLLVDPDGRVLARLVPGGRPAVDADTAPSEGEPPVLTDELRRQLSTVAAPLPEGLRPAAGADLVGRWVRSDAAGAGDHQPFVRFAADGDWDGSDGCNAQGGRWVLGSAGSFLTVAGPQTLIGCVGAGADIRLSAAVRAGIDGDELVLLDPTGREVGRLRSG